MVENLEKVVIYTDGACTGNPGPGGYGVVLKSDHKRRELSGGYRLTTNNRMELMAAIVGLSALNKPCKVTLYSDSRYLVETMNEGKAKKWQMNGWKRNKKERALNPDLWQKLLDLCELHRVTFVWVAGHSGNSENERCDHLSTRAYLSHDLPSDTGYEEPTAPSLPLFD
jgi:ribonuclease HI